MLIVRVETQNGSTLLMVLVLIFHKSFFFLACSSHWCLSLYGCQSLLCIRKIQLEYNV